ncbi:hypothetical protein M378DRAFT_91866, partial [Amanita muscaria Koide BX008]
MFLGASGLLKNPWSDAMHHVVWMIRRTLLIGREGKMPFEAVFGTKPGLKAVSEWGESVTIHSNSRAEEGRWTGVD